MRSHNEVSMSAYPMEDVSADFSRPTRTELSRLQVLQRVDLDAVEELLAGCLVRVLAPGEVLVHAGEVSPAMYFVLAGRFQAHDPSATVADAVIEAGGSLGELSLFQSLPSCTTATALEPARVLAVDYQTAGVLIATSSMAARNLLNGIAEHLRAAPPRGAGTKPTMALLPDTTIDEATGLHNRHWLETTLPRHIMRSTATLKPLSLLLVEIDGYARYKDDFGHDAQHQVLYEIAQALFNNVRPTDTVARYGDGLFAIVLPEADLSGTYIVATRLRQAVSETVVMMPDESILPSVTISDGAAQYEPLTDAAGMIARAEQRLRQQRGEPGSC